jgi:hypothetical protein
MSFPSEGVEAVYRNEIKEVSRFLEERHRSCYMIFNLSERPYDHGWFDHRVVELGFPDHFAPPVDVTWTLCLTMHAWLSASPDHVVAVHCLAGKGRTGVIIAAYMLFAGTLFQQPLAGGAYGNGGSEDDGGGNPFGPPASALPSATHPMFPLPSPTEMARAALVSFRCARGEGVKNPSQERTVRYFARVVHAAIIAAHAELSGEETEELGAAPHPDDFAHDELLATGSHGLPVSALPEGPTWVLWGAAVRVRGLKTLPLPRVVTLRVTRVLLSGLPPLSTLSVSDAAFGSAPAGAGAPPVVCLTTAPYQGTRTRTLYNSSCHDASTVVFSPAAEMPLVGQYGFLGASAGPLGCAMYALDAVVRGDVLLTCHVGGGGSKEVHGGSAQVFRASFHSSFLLREAGREAASPGRGVYRLAARDVDQDKGARAAYQLQDNQFYCDLFYDILPEGETSEGEAS